jgi:signal transduction histidine kinase/HAMP domain-containing protein
MNMLGLRQKLSIGFGALLIIIIVIGVESITLLSKLGQSIDVILRENYRSVIACQEMKEALERVDSGILFTLLGFEREGREYISKNELRFEKALQIELNNITLPGEPEKAVRLRDLFTHYRTALKEVQDPAVPIALRSSGYFTKLLPLFQQIKDTADDILQINQQNMSDANDQARESAASAQRRMYVLLLIGACVAVGFVFLTGRLILRPITRLIRSADEIRRGNLELVVQSGSRDEIGRLSEAFNAMTASLREFRRSNRAKLLRFQRSTEQAFNNLSDAVVVLDLEGRVEIATEVARTDFGFKPATVIWGLGFDYAVDLFNEALKTGRMAEPKKGRTFIQRFVRGEERYYRPKAVPIMDAESQPTGVVLILSDVTQQRHQDEMKSGVISTVSHQLRTPLTSIRMAVYLLLEEKVGTLTPKQEELLLAAREDSERLHRILTDLLDISRMESGKVQIECRAVSPHDLVFEAVEPLRSAAQDRGVTLTVTLADDLPEVWADTTQVGHVFANLLSNALKYTAPGGVVTLSAESAEESVSFSVSDTGKGIPSYYHQRIFEPFFRVPGQGMEIETGAGLGLAIAKEIVEAHGGNIAVKSREGEGSTFVFSLRRADRVSVDEHEP